MDNRPIGFFDSGLGGLTSIAPLRRALPEERIIYYGDTARTPYGSKSPNTIKTFSRQISDFLIQQDVKMIVIACNTVSATCLSDLQQRHASVPILGIIHPAAETVAKTCTKDNHIGIIGTKVTIKSHTYEDSIQELNPNLDIHATPCPAFVPLIEEGILQHEIMDLTIQYYMDHFISYHHIDTLVLGCTHYPLIRKNIEKLYPKLRIINPSDEIVARIKEVLEKRDLFAQNSNAENTFFASDLSENFVNMINRIFENSEFKVAFKSFDLDTNEKKTEGK
ncbi:glutamate racemase [Sinanaerobacter sp. ZZT-01]|uniref:glutamate racemase n=1 Tax=Sinanaerobacter sp. ZZT-01 TaxID=3111540 RepID=UPI002D77E524|nr:glutamate racemase [Sinanaerobacter sp. ZZT-01]WRR93334.1 glutamate racemase [Sinanaerobacter sp. ZZT-01]